VTKAKEEACDLSEFTFATPPCYVADLTGIAADYVKPLIFSEAYTLTTSTGNNFPIPRGASFPTLSHNHSTGAEVWTYYNDHSDEFDLGKVLQWNTFGLKLHAFHQHVFPYQLQEDFQFVFAERQGWPHASAWFKTGDFHDTISLPWDCNNPTAGYQPAMKVKTNVGVYNGSMIAHCHFLTHEDGGMMLNFLLKGKPGTPGKAKFCLGPDDPAVPATVTKEGTCAAKYKPTPPPAPTCSELKKDYKDAGCCAA
jgi:hypothetical protein